MTPSHATRRAHSISPIESAIAVIIIVFMARGLVWIFGGVDPTDRGGISESGFSYSLTSGIIYSYALYRLIRMNIISKEVLVAAWPMILFVFIAFLSTFWSISPSDSFVRSVSLAGTILTGVYLWARFPSRNLISIFGIAFVAMTIASIALANFLPLYGKQNIGDNMGNWRGIYSHKNPAAYSTILGLITTAYLAATSRRPWPWLIGSALCVIMLLGSSSRTSLIAISITISITILILMCTSRSVFVRQTSVLYAMLIAISTYYVWTSADSILNALGRDTTLTGRGLIWPAAIKFWATSPILGHGYQAAYLSPEGMPRYMYGIGWRWLPSHSHNSYIDVMLGVGLLGLLTFAMGVITAAVRAIKSFRERTRPEVAWTLVAMIAICVIGFSGRVIMQPNTVELLITTIFILAAAQASPGALRQRAG
ncbi:O-antigen ligase family protein [Brevundimonas balnearis]|uniref:O-antigen ligase family protein n=1 Tax=Brevundimonas balnearis TaxID=1572858 RepID=A0ABV6QYN3_9CAUL